jgi:hypothetical protein
MLKVKSGDAVGVCDHSGRDCRATAAAARALVRNDLRVVNKGPLQKNMVQIRDD